jgi:hypothetical protein
LLYTVRNLIKNCDVMYLKVPSLYPPDFYIKELGPTHHSAPITLGGKVYGDNTGFNTIEYTIESSDTVNGSVAKWAKTMDLWAAIVIMASFTVKPEQKAWTWAADGAVWVETRTRVGEGYQINSMILVYKKDLLKTTSTVHIRGQINGWCTQLPPNDRLKDSTTNDYGSWDWPRKATPGQPVHPPVESNIHRLPKVPRQSAC